MIQRFWDTLTDKRQLSMRDRNTDKVHWRVTISPLALWSSLLALVVVIFLTLLLLMAYTSILDILPGYRHRADKLHDSLTENIIRLDSMERHMNMILEYNEAVSSILGGGTPALHSTVLTDTIRYDKSRILPTRADTLQSDVRLSQRLLRLPPSSKRHASNSGTYRMRAGILTRLSTF